MANRTANGMSIKIVIKSKCALTNPLRELCNYFNCLMSKGVLLYGGTKFLCTQARVTKCLVCKYVCMGIIVDSSEVSCLLIVDTRRMSDVTFALKWFGIYMYDACV